MKLRPTDIEAAFMRVVLGESVNSVARGLSVSEGALRWRFKREGRDAVEVRRAAWQLYAAQLAYERLSTLDRLTVNRLVMRLVVRLRGSLKPEQPQLFGNQYAYLQSPS